MMKNVLLMSVFALFMTVAFAGQSVSNVSLVTASFAGNNHESNHDSNSNNDGNTTSIAFSCPEGVATCYRADGSEYTDVNNLTATASGVESDDGHESNDTHVSTATYANPRHYRSF